MKRSNLVTGITFALALGFGGMGVASAMPMIAPEPLQNGLSRPSVAPITNVDRYSFSLDTPTQVSMASEGRGAVGLSIRLRARVVDENGNLVTQANHRGGHFSIEETLQPGDYVLEVKSYGFGGRHQSPYRYRVRTQMN